MRLAAPFSPKNPFFPNFPQKIIPTTGTGYALAYSVFLFFPLFCTPSFKRQLEPRAKLWQETPYPPPGG